MRGAIDVHVHLAALPEGDNGCYISPRMMRNPITRYLAWAQGLDLRQPTESNVRYVVLLLRELSLSEKVRQAVLLGPDGVYGAWVEVRPGHNRFFQSKPPRVPGYQVLP